MTTTTISIPFRDSVPSNTVLTVLHDALGDTPGRGWIRLIVEREQPGSGPGTELKKLLARIGIVPAVGCKCLERAAIMDRGGCEWCEANVDTITGWLAEEAAARGLPFVDTAGRLLVRLAIRNARRQAADVSGGNRG